MAKFLILRFSAIGDIVLTSPVLRCLKKQVQDAEIHFAVKERFKEAVVDNEYVDYFHFYNDNLNELIKIWKNEEFDYIIDLHHNLRTWYIKLRLWKIKSYSFNKRNIEKWILVKFKKNKIPKNEHIVHRYLKTVDELGVKDDQQGLDFFIPEHDEKFFNELPQQYQPHSYVAISAAASKATKMFTVQKLIELCEKINLPIIFLGSPADFKAIEKVRSVYPDKIYNACGKCTLASSAFVIKKAMVTIAYDTGLMHIASALKVPVISVWGNTVPEMGMYPFKTQHWIVENKINCRPCSKIGFNKCPQKHFNCMNQINVNEIVNIVNHIYKNKK